MLRYSPNHGTQRLPDDDDDDDDDDEILCTTQPCHLWDVRLINIQLAINDPKLLCTRHQDNNRKRVKDCISLDNYT